MKKAETLMKEQDAVRVCRFCCQQYDYYRRDESGLGVCPRMRSFFSEWCSKECFWNDFLAQAKAEMAMAKKEKSNCAEGGGRDNTHPCAGVFP
jgi:hypothetical protein